jgi:hypothetical protein
MRKREALKLHNRDQVEVNVFPHGWIDGYVLGEPREESEKVVVIPVQTSEGFVEAIHTSIR